MRLLSTALRRGARLSVLLSLALIAALVGTLVNFSASNVALAASLTSIFELDGNLTATGAPPPWDWANSGTLTAPTTNGGVWTRSGSGGIFDGGVFNGTTTPPTKPSLTAAAAANTSIASTAFAVDPLSVDHTACPNVGDPTVFTGQGSETNNGDLNSFTYNTGSVPNKDEVSNAYAIAWRNATDNKVYFGAERVINNGDSHIDFEFLQAGVTIPNACGSGTTKMSGHRSQGDLLISIEFTQGGVSGTPVVHMWDCGTSAAVGTICDPTGKKNSPQYIVDSSVPANALIFTVNSGPNGIGAGGWVARNADGTPTTTIAQNELMEGGIDLNALGFTGCINTFLPHTRSSQSFTAVLKDFAPPLKFNTCASPTISTQVKNTNGTASTSDDTNVSNNGHVALGTTVYDTATLANATASAGGTVTYKLFTDNTCTTLSTTPALNDTVTVTNAAVPASSTVTFSQTGTYYFQAIYSGDATNQVPAGGAKSGCTSEVVVVDKLSPTISTQVKNTNGTVSTGDDTNVANNGHVSIGTSVYDTSTLSGATSDAGGTVTYTLYSDSACTVAATSPSLSDTQTVTNGSVPDSASITFTQAGTFYFQATYSGDSNNTGPVSSGCSTEIIVIDQNAPTIATQVKNTNGTGSTSDDTNVANNGHVPIGTTLYDTASLTGATSDAGGTVTYTLYTDSKCTVASTTPALSSTVTVTNGSIPDSSSITFNAAGTWYFQATYSGDSNNFGPVSSGCSSEIVVVDANAPSFTSTPAAQINDSATISGLTSDATGTVTFRLFPPSNSTCDTNGTYTDVKVSTVTGNIVNGSFTDSTSYQAATAGTWRWVVIYSGDSNNTATATTCNDESVTVSITALQ